MSGKQEEITGAKKKTRVLHCLVMRRGIAHISYEYFSQVQKLL